MNKNNAKADNMPEPAKELIRLLARIAVNRHLENYHNCQNTDKQSNNLKENSDEKNSIIRTL